LSVRQKETFLKKININIPVFFTKIRYADVLMRSDKSLDASRLTGQDFLLVTGIADTHHLITYLKKKYKTFDHLKFKDHHRYSPADAKMINDRAEKKLILTTEKDFVKLENTLNNSKLYCLRIELDFVFDEEQHFFEKIIRAL